MSTNHSATIVQRLWNYYNTLRDGVSLVNQTGFMTASANPGVTA